MSDNDSTGIASEPVKTDGGQDKDGNNQDHSQSKTVQINEEKLKGFEARVAKAESIAKDYKARLDQIAEDEAKKRGEYETLLSSKKEEAEKLQKELDDYKAIQEESVKTLEKYYQEELEQLPEDKRELVPESLSLNEKLELVRKLAKHFVKGISKGFPKNTENNPLSEVAELERRIKELTEKHSKNGLSQVEESELIQKSRELRRLKEE
jgi:hypothetical protein